MVFRVRGVLEEFREIPPVKFRRVPHYTFTFTKSIIFVYGVQWLSSSQARTHRSFITGATCHDSSYFDKIRKYFAIIKEHNTEFRSFCNSYCLVWLCLRITKQQNCL